MSITLPLCRQRGYTQLLPPMKLPIDEQYDAVLRQVADFAQAAEQVAQTDELAPSLLVIAVQPRAPESNSSVQVAGQVSHLAKALAQVLSNPDTHGAFIQALADEMELHLLFG